MCIYFRDYFWSNPIHFTATVQSAPKKKAKKLRSLKLVLDAFSFPTSPYSVERKCQKEKKKFIYVATLLWWNIIRTDVKTRSYEIHARNSLLKDTTLSYVSPFFLFFFQNIILNLSSLIRSVHFLNINCTELALVPTQTYVICQIGMHDTRTSM